MYKIIGADGQEYGPVTADQLKQWIAEGRANHQTKVLPDGAAEWRLLAEIPELATALPISPRSPSAAPVATTGAVSAANLVSGPAVGLIATACLGFLVQLAALLMNILGVSFGAMQHQAPAEAWMNLFSGSLGVVSSIVGLVVSVVIFVGGLKMMRLQSHGWAMTASILALAPCISPCCLIGLPIGIWALIVLAKPEVKAAFGPNL